MLTAITSTHAVPQQLPSSRISAKATIVVCHYCFHVLGLANSMDRRALESEHRCSEKLTARQPAISVPFS
jgi:hypothetical protein